MPKPKAEAFAAKHAKKKPAEAPAAAAIKTGEHVAGDQGAQAAAGAAGATAVKQAGAPETPKESNDAGEVPALGAAFEVGQVVITSSCKKRALYDEQDARIIRMRSKQVPPSALFMVKVVTICYPRLAGRGGGDP